MKMKKILKVLVKMSNPALLGLATFMLTIGTEAISRCVVPLWHNEPEMPQSMRNEM
jgi:hypothetical protein